MTLSTLSARKLNALIDELEIKLTAAKLALRTQKAAELTLQLRDAKHERMRRAKQRKVA